MTTKDNNGKICTGKRDEEEQARVRTGNGKCVSVQLRAMS